MALSPTFLQPHNLTPKLFLFALLTAGLPAFSTAQESSNLTYYSSASEVSIVFFPTEQNHPVPEIAKNDFAVVDNEQVIRDFRGFTRSPETKLDVVVLLDSSDSVLPRFQQQITNFLQLLSQWPWKPGDEVSVLSFSGTQTHILCTGDCVSSLTADQVATTPRGGSTPLFDALDDAARLLQSRQQPDVWPVIILFSDGEDTISIASYDQALQSILMSRTHVYAVDLSGFGPSRGTRTLRKLADASGGRYVENGDDVTRIYTGVLNDLHSARVVTYALPPSNSTFHAVRILPTHNLNLQFRSVHGYYAHASNTHPEANP